MLANANCLLSAHATTGNPFESLDCRGCYKAEFNQLIYKGTDQHLITLRQEFNVAKAKAVALLLFRKRSIAAAQRLQYKKYFELGRHE